MFVASWTFGLGIVGSSHAATPPDGLPLVWTAESNQEACEFGSSVGSAGDVDGDGYDDVLVAAPFYSQGEPIEGAVFLYLGSSGGLGSTPAWIAQGDQTSALFGTSVGAADVNADGFHDVLVTANSYDNGEEWEGRAYLYLGSSSGPSTTPDWGLELNQVGASLGAMSSAGDVDADGYEDVLVGAPGYDGDVVGSGLARLYLGSALGLSADALWEVSADAYGTGFALSGAVEGAGDVNGDGFDDVMLASMFDDGQWIDEGSVIVFHGSATGPEATQDWEAVGDQDDAHFGDSFAAGDVDGDGFDDLVVGASGYDDNEGRAFLYLGSPSGLSDVAAWIVEPGLPDQLFGTSVSVADVNNDGFADVAVGSTRFDNGQGDEGRIQLYLGSATGLGTTEVWTAESDHALSQFGSSQAAAGDVNADGYGDLLVGAYSLNNGTDGDEGQVFLYAGAAFVGGPTEPEPPPDVDEDGDGVAAADDCDDTNATVFPGAPELCDGLDNTCAGEVPAQESDQDGDDISPCGGDCDDGDPNVSPARPELCNAVDDNCDGGVDESCADDEAPATAKSGCTCGGQGTEEMGVVAWALVGLLGRRRLTSARPRTRDATSANEGSSRARI